MLLFYVPFPEHTDAITSTRHRAAANSTHYYLLLPTTRPHCFTERREASPYQASPLHSTVALLHRRSGQCTASPALHLPILCFTILHAARSVPAARSRLVVYCRLLLHLRPSSAAVFYQQAFYVSQRFFASTTRSSFRATRRELGVLTLAFRYYARPRSRFLI